MNQERTVQLPEDFWPKVIHFPEFKPVDEYLSLPNEYLLLKNYRMILSDKRRYYLITAKAGYRYDGFSIPWAFRVFHGKHEGAIGVALFHDLDFETHFLNSVAKADWMFLLGLEYREYRWTRRNAMWAGLRCGSWRVYPKTEAEIAAGRKYLEIEDITDNFQKWMIT